MALLRKCVRWTAILVASSLAGCGVTDGPSLLASSTGGTTSNSLPPLPTVSFSNSLAVGTPSFYQFIDGPAGGLAVDYAGHVLLGFYSNGNIETAAATGSGNTDGAIVRWDASGTLVAKKDLPASGSSQYYGLTVNDLKVAADNSYYITGAASKDMTNPTPAPATGDSDIYLAKYSAAGVLLWARQYGYAATYSQGNRIALDASGNVYLVGSAAYNVATNAAAPSGGFFTMKFDASGNRQWVKQSPTVDNPSQGYGVTVSSAGNVYVAGTSSRNYESTVDYTTSSLAYLVKYDSAGNLVWIRSKGAAGNISFVTNDVVFDEVTSTLYVVGMTNQTWSGTGSPTGNNDYYIAKYLDAGSSGTFVSARQFGASGATSVAQSIKLDSSRNLVVTGYTSGYVGTGGGGMIGSGDAFVGRYDSALAPIWVNHYGIPTFDTKASGLVIDGSDHILIGGYSSGNPVTGSGAAVGGYDAYVRGYKVDGTAL